MLKYILILTLLVLLLASYFHDIHLSINLFISQKQKQTVFTQEELSSYDGVQTPFLYLAILGKIYNVTKGHKHYGTGQQYHFFIGKDASRNFITGKFNDKDASDDVSGLNPHDLISLQNWLKFYEKEYQKVGVVVGRYYNEYGALTPYAKEVKKLIAKAQNIEMDKQLEKHKFPPCNIEWSAGKGSRVWCTNRSGGITREWVGKPRQYYEPGSKSYRCACIHKGNENLGSIKEYTGCDSNSDSCFVDIT